MNLSKCKMMLDDLTKVTMTHSELLNLKRVVDYTYEQLMTANTEIVNYVTPEEFNLDVAKANNLQLVFDKQVLEYSSQLGMRQEISRLIKLHEELYMAHVQVHNIERWV